MVKCPEGTKKIFYSWSEYLELVEKLGKILEGKKFDFIVAVKRGGWLIGVILSHKLRVPLVDVDDSESLGGEYGCWKYVLGRKKRLLVVDDVSDSGNTLKVVLKKLGSCYEIKVATLFRKPWTKVEPDYYVKSTRNWVVWPFEVDE